MTEHASKKPDAVSAKTTRTEAIPDSTPELNLAEIARKAARFTPGSLKPPDIMQLQRTIGNQAVMRLMQEQAEPAAEKPVASPVISPKPSPSAIQRLPLQVPSIGTGIIQSTELRTSVKYHQLSYPQLLELSKAIYSALDEYSMVAMSLKEQQDLEYGQHRIDYFLQDYVMGLMSQGLTNINAISTELGQYTIEGQIFTAEALAAELHVPVELLTGRPNEDKSRDAPPVIGGVPPRPYTVPALMQALDKSAEDLDFVLTDRVGFMPSLTGKEAERFGEKFNPDHEPEFLDELKRFRSNNNTAPNIQFAGGEGQIYLSDANPNLCLKRWYAKRIKDKALSISLLKQARTAVMKDPYLAARIEVVQIYTDGSDWMVRDFDPRSVKIEKAAGPLINQVIGRLTELQDNDILKDILKKLRNQSDNIHWSPSLNKILVIDMM